MSAKGHEETIRPNKHRWFFLVVKFVFSGDLHEVLRIGFANHIAQKLNSKKSVKQ